MSVRILVDADACPVKEEIFRVALRHGVAVTVVANAYLRVPEHPLFSRKIVSDGFDAADDWIAEAADELSIVITSDIPLADRSLKKGARVLAPTGKPFTNDSIGTALATREIMADLRVGVAGIGAKGPAPFSKADRSRFLSALDTVLVALKRAAGETGDPAGSV